MIPLMSFSALSGLVSWFVIKNRSGPPEKAGFTLFFRNFWGILGEKGEGVGGEEANSLLYCCSREMNVDGFFVLFCVMWRGTPEISHFEHLRGIVGGVFGMVFVFLPNAHTTRHIWILGAETRAFNKTVG